LYEESRKDASFQPKKNIRESAGTRTGFSVGRVILGTMKRNLSPRTLYSAGLLAAAAAVLFASCLPGPNSSALVQSADAEPAGFLLGLWHGIICVVSFIVSFFKKDVNIYETVNNGWQYNAGYLLGLMISLGGSARGSCGQKKEFPPCADGRNPRKIAQQESADEQ